MARTNGTIDPAVLDKLSGLELVARRAVEGFMAGVHASPQRGSSVEFAQHRAYAPGDEVRKVDWKVFARSERLVVKEYVEETNLSLNLLVDASESMGFGSTGWTKLDYARWGAAALAHLVLGKRDTAGLVIFDDSIRAKVPPGNGAPQEAAILRSLEEASPGGPTAVGEVLHSLVPRIRRRGITAVFSDFFDDIDSILEGIKRLVHEGHEPILFQVVDPLETSFDLDALVKLEGLEGDRATEGADGIHRTARGGGGGDEDQIPEARRRAEGARGGARRGRGTPASRGGGAAGGRRRGGTGSRRARPRVRLAAGAMGVR